ncbi:hypothetical protein Dimus_014265 [Dionaea muscipula]
MRPVGGKLLEASRCQRLPSSKRLPIKWQAPSSSPSSGEHRAAPHQAASTEQRSGEPRSSEQRALPRLVRAAGTPPLARAAALLRPATPWLRAVVLRVAAPRRELLGEHWKAGEQPQRTVELHEGGQQASKLPTPGSTPASGGERPEEWWRAVDSWRAPSFQEASSGSDMVSASFLSSGTPTPLPHGQL